MLTMCGTVEMVCFTTVFDPLKDSLMENINTFTSRVRVVEFNPPTSPYITISFEGIVMYEIAGGFIENDVKYADHTFSCLFLRFEE